MTIRPHYPVYIPSKGRSQSLMTVNCFLEDDVDFRIVVEPAEFDNYAAALDAKYILTLPADNMRLLGARNWIRDYSIANGDDRHWQLDDNIHHFKRVFQSKRIRVDPNIALAVVEDFTDRYENIGLSGLQYSFFITNDTLKPLVTNCHVYSCTLVNNRMPYTWRILYNDDTDLCLQVLSGGLCTVLFNTFAIFKAETLTMKGGNTDDLYRADGRLKMARELERLWPGVVRTGRRWKRPQHLVKGGWKYFTTPLIRRKDLDWKKISKRKYDMDLVAVAPVKCPELRKLLKDYRNP